MWLKASFRILFWVILDLSLVYDRVVVAIEESAAGVDPECVETNEDGVFELILSQDHEVLDSTLTDSISKLKERGAHRCWHKHSTFLDHLVGVHEILRLWGQGKTIGRVGLFHSAYSNSYVNLALFDPNSDADRETLRQMVGKEAEELIYLFCTIDRQDIVVNTLLKNGYIPPEGIRVPHLHNKDQLIHVSAETLLILTVFTMADTSDQHFGWQDRLFGGNEMINSMLLPGEDDAARHESTALWPGLSQPGLFMSYVSQLCAVVRTFENAKNQSGIATDDFQDDRTADVPPVFDNCTQTLTRDNEASARDFYWKVVTGEVSNEDDIIHILQECTKYNPWAFEPHVMLAQKYMHRNDFESGLKAAGRALELQAQWGTAWDKRLSFPAWVAWTRVLYQRAEDQKEWPANSWDVNNFGLVR